MIYRYCFILSFMDEDKTVVMKATLRYKKGYSNTLVGQCVQVPFIIVEGQSVQELTRELFYEFKVYFKTFPEEGKKILEKYGKIIQTEEEKQQTERPFIYHAVKEEGWTEKNIEVPIPISH